MKIQLNKSLSLALQSFDTVLMSTLLNQGAVRGLSVWGGGGGGEGDFKFNPRNNYRKLKGFLGHLISYAHKRGGGAGG